MKSARRSGCWSSWNESAHSAPRLASMPRMARFIFANRQVVGLLSWRTRRCRCGCRRVSQRSARPARTCLRSHSTGRTPAVVRAQHVGQQRRPTGACRTRPHSCLRWRRTGRGKYSYTRPSTSRPGVLGGGEVVPGEGVDQPAQRGGSEFAAQVVLGRTPFSEGFSFSMASMAASMRWPMSVCFATLRRSDQR